MARVFRTMLADGHRPRVGDGDDMLGVRTGIDVKPDNAGNVAPGKGMSVGRAWHELPFKRIPRRLEDKMPNGFPIPMGSNETCIWQMGDGPFADGDLENGLRLRVTQPKHAQIEPGAVMPLVELQKRLAGTVDAWHPIDEDSDCPARTP